MKEKFTVIAAALLMLAACQAEPQIEESPISETPVEEAAQPKVVKEGVVPPEVTASLEIGAPTKSLIEVDGEGVGTIYWTPSDEINVFYGTTSTRYISKNTVNATTAVFKTLDVIGTTESASENIWGLYPYNENASCTGSAVTTTLPANQKGVPGTFDDDLYITLAHNTSTALVFWNVCGGIKFSLSRNDITSITFRGNNNEDIAGDISLTFDGETNLPVATVLNGAKEITLTPKTGTTFASGENYYIILLPGTLSSGFTMTFETTSGSTGNFNYTDKAVTIKRSVFSKKADIDEYVTNLPIPSNQIWYTSSDGEIVTPYQPSAFGVNIVSNTYSDSKGIFTFDGDVTIIDGSAFWNCKTLTSITLPNSLTTISGYHTFNGTGLTSIVLPESLTTLSGIATFAGCTALSSVVIPNVKGNLGTGRTFQGCTSLTSITIPDSITSLGASYSFQGCTSLTSITIPEEATYIGSNLFRGCSNLTSITIPNKITSIRQSAFSGCTALTSITIPSSVTEVREYAFKDCTSLLNITILCPDPPAVTEGASFGAFDNTNNAPIFVPAESVDSFRIADGWNEYAERIQAIQ